MYVKATRTPVIYKNGSYSSVTYVDGLIGPCVTEEEATHFLIHSFHIEEKNKNENSKNVRRTSSD